MSVEPIGDEGETVIDPKDGAVLLDDVEKFLARFVAYPSAAARVATALFVAHAHLIDRFESTPRLATLSPEAGSGKTRNLEVMEALVPRPVHAVNVTPAYLFRKVGDPAGPPTILFDEIDTVFGAKAKDNEDLRGLLNAGHRKGATAGRCVVRGRTIETEELPAYAAVAIAGLGDLPDTVMSRSIVIRMRRRTPDEQVEPWRRRVHEKEGHELRDRLADWALRVGDDVEKSWPEMPDGVSDRAADVWEPLLAVADAAGGDWPVRARVAAVTLVTASAERPATLGVRLLTDLRLLFLKRTQDGAPVVPEHYEHDHLKTEDVIKGLCDLPESPWADLRGKPIDATRLSRYLKQYGVGPKPIRVGADVARGYKREDLHDPWSRYLPPVHPEAVTGATRATPDLPNGEEGLALRVAPVAPVTPGAQDRPPSNPEGAHTECVRCGNALLVELPGRDTCAKCVPVILRAVGGSP